MALRELSGESEFLDAVSSPGTVLVDCWAAWCGPCRAFAPIFEGAAAAHPEALFVKLDTDANEDVARQLAIQSIPTLLAFRDGILVFRQSGVLPAAALEQLLAEIASLDMDAVRRDFEAQQQPGAAAAAAEPHEGRSEPVEGEPGGTAG